MVTVKGRRHSSTKPSRRLAVWAWRHSSGKSWHRAPKEARRRAPTRRGKPGKRCSGVTATYGPSAETPCFGYGTRRASDTWPHCSHTQDASFMCSSSSRADDRHLRPKPLERRPPSSDFGPKATVAARSWTPRRRRPTARACESSRRTSMRATRAPIRRGRSRARAEIDALTAQLSAAFGLGGRARPEGSSCRAGSTECRQGGARRTEADPCTGLWYRRPSCPVGAHRPVLRI